MTQRPRICANCNSSSIHKGRRYWTCIKCGYVKHKPTKKEVLLQTVSNRTAKYRKPSMPTLKFMDIE